MYRITIPASRNTSKNWARVNISTRNSKKEDKAGHIPRFRIRLDNEIIDAMQLSMREDRMRKMAIYGARNPYKIKCK
jgi:hypothetical protein